MLLMCNVNTTLVHIFSEQSVLLHIPVPAMSVNPLCLYYLYCNIPGSEQLFSFLCSGFFFFFPLFLFFFFFTVP